MALQVWLPLTKDLRNQGLGRVQITNNTNFILKSGGKLGTLCLDLSNTVRLYSPDLVNLKTFSFAFWYRPETSESTINWNDVIGFNDSKGGLFRLETSYSNSYMLSMHNNTQYGIMQNVASSYGSTLLLSSASYSRDVWYHIAVTVEEDDNVKAYVNGELKCIVARSDGSITGYFNLGELGGSNKEDGSLNDLRIYDHCLSPIEVKELSKGLVLHYPLNRQGWGQENLLLNTNDLTKWSKENSCTITLENDGYYHIVSTNTNGSRYGIFYDLTFPEVGTYTLSADVRTDWRIGFAASSSFGWIANTITGTGNAQHVIKTITTTSENNKCRIYISSQMNSSGVVTNSTYIKNIKVEKGSIATPWCPNSSDALATTMDLNGTTEYDCSGFCNNGVRNKTFTWTSDTPKYTVSQNFNNNHLIEAEGLPTETSTIACWIKWHTLPSGYIIPIHDKQSGLAIGLTGGTRLITYVGATAGGTGSCVYVSLETNTWYHIAIIKTGATTRKVYINGEEITSIAPNNWWGGDLDKFLVGGRHISGGYSNYINGQICDVRAYATALSADDVQALYKSNKL